MTWCDAPRHGRPLRGAAFRMAVCGHARPSHGRAERVPCSDFGTGSGAASSTSSAHVGRRKPTPSQEALSTVRRRLNGGTRSAPTLDAAQRPSIRSVVHILLRAAFFGLFPKPEDAHATSLTHPGKPHQDDNQNDHENTDASPGSALRVYAGSAARDQPVAIPGDLALQDSD